MDDTTKAAILADLLPRLAVANAEMLGMLVAHLETKGLTTRADFADLLDRNLELFSEASLVEQTIATLRYQGQPRPFFTVISGGRDED